MTTFLLSMLACSSHDATASDEPRSYLASRQSDKASTPPHFEDGSCVGDPPAPICTPVHLSTPKPLDEPRACETRADCLPYEFCGAGACRTLEGESATLCVERVWAEGVLCDKGRTIDAAEFTALPRGYSADLEMIFRATLELSDTCVVDIAECDVISLDDWDDPETKVFARIEVGEKLFGSRLYPPGAEGLRQAINSGCQLLHGNGFGPSHEPVVSAHYAIWYP